MNADISRTADLSDEVRWKAFAQECIRISGSSICFLSKHEKKPKPIKGLEGLYSLKRLSEII